MKKYLLLALFILSLITLLPWNTTSNNHENSVLDTTDKNSEAILSTIENIQKKNVANELNTLEKAGNGGKGGYSLFNQSGNDGDAGSIFSTTIDPK